MGEGDGMQVGQFRSFLSRQDGAVVPCCRFLHGWLFFGGFPRIQLHLALISADTRIVGSSKCVFFPRTLW